MNRRFSEEEQLETLDEEGYLPQVKNIPHKKSGPGRLRPARPQPVSAPIPNQIIEQEDDRFEMTYKAARHEAIWLEQSLEDFFKQKWFDDVLRMVKGGKEASVYLCAGNETTGADYLAAKVYRPQRFRNLKNDWLYREGRGNLDESGRNITNKGMLHAMHKKTDYGRELLHTSWLEHEFQCLSILHAAGADVPRPYASSANAILLGYYGDEVMGAPALNEINLPTAEARALFERVIHNINLMLSMGRIHGDLSAFNILYWEGEIAIIDFPQAVRPTENRSAYRIFERDVVRVCEYFQHQGVRSNPRQLAAEMWRRSDQPIVPLVDPKALGEDNDSERDIWESLKNT